MIEFPSVTTDHRGLLQDNHCVTGWSVMISDAKSVLVEDSVVLLFFVVHDKISIVDGIVFCVIASFCVSFVVICVVDIHDDHPGIALSNRGVFCTIIINIAKATITSMMMLSIRKKSFIYDIYK